MNAKLLFCLVIIENLSFIVFEHSDMTFIPGLTDDPLLKGNYYGNVRDGSKT